MGRTPEVPRPRCTKIPGYGIVDFQHPPLRSRCCRDRFGRCRLHGQRFDPGLGHCCRTRRTSEPFDARKTARHGYPFKRWKTLPNSAHSEGRRHIRTASFVGCKTLQKISKTLECNGRNKHFLGDRAHRGALISGRFQTLLPCISILVHPVRKWIQASSHLKFNSKAACKRGLP